MRLTGRANLDVSIEATAVMTLENPDIDIAEAVDRLRAAGNDILSVDGRRITVMNTKTNPTEEVWVCDHCDAYSKNESVILEHEKECRSWHRS